MAEYPTAFELNEKALDFEEQMAAEAAEDTPGVTKVVRINKAKFNNFFEDKDSNIEEYFSKTVIEFRLTIG